MGLNIIYLSIDRSIAHITKLFDVVCVGGSKMQNALLCFFLCIIHIYHISFLFVDQPYPPYNSPKLSIISWYYSKRPLLS